MGGRNPTEPAMILSRIRKLYSVNRFSMCEKQLSKRLDRSVLQTEVVQIFNAAIKSPVTRDVYERRLLNFLNHMKMTPDEFVSLAKSEPLGAEKKIIDFAFELKRRHERGDIAAIVSVEDFFSSKESLQLPNHSLEQSPCYPIIGCKYRRDYTIYYCKLHRKVENANLESIEHHCRFAEPDHHKAEIMKSFQE
jgi:hypothetical protein